VLEQRLGDVGSRNLYFGEKLMRSAGATVVTDRLGSVRANSNGERMNYFPYGEERTATADGREKFGTYFRDAGGVDYADQRYYASGNGRFLTADSYPGVNLRSPITWNKYSYVNGDPVNLFDPSGNNAANPDGGSGYGPNGPCGPNWVSDASLSGPCTVGGGGGGDGGGGGGGFCVDGVCATPDGGCSFGGQFFGPDAPICAQLRIVIKSPNEDLRNECIDRIVARALEDEQGAINKEENTYRNNILALNTWLAIKLLSDWANEVSVAIDLALEEAGLIANEVRHNTALAEIAAERQKKIRRGIEDCNRQYPY
jgi:RHS repeat-associated protein